MENGSNQTPLDNNRSGYNNLNNNPINRDFRNNSGNYQTYDRNQPIATPNQNPPSRFDRYYNNEQPNNNNPIQQAQPSQRFNEQRNQDNFRPSMPAPTAEPRRFERPIEQRPREMGNPGGGGNSGSGGFRPR